MSEERLKDIQDNINERNMFPNRMYIFREDINDEEQELYNEVIRLREKLNQRNIAGIQVVVSGETYNEYKGTLQDQISELENRIDKAIEYIEQCDLFFELEEHKYLLNILRGEDK